MSVQQGTDLGSAVTYIFSPTGTVLVKDEGRPDPLWKLPGGHIEPSDAGVIAAAIREVLFETGIQLTAGEIRIVKEQRRTGNSYQPYLCIARVSESKLRTRKRIGDENGKPLKTRIFSRAEALSLADIIRSHLFFIREIEEG